MTGGGLGGSEKGARIRESSGGSNVCWALSPDYARISGWLRFRFAGVVPAGSFSAAKFPARRFRVPPCGLRVRGFRGARAVAFNPKEDQSMSVTMREMLEAGVHFGHQTRYWNPKMEQYIFG